MSRDVYVVRSVRGNGRAARYLIDTKGYGMAPRMAYANEFLIKGVTGPTLFSSPEEAELAALNVWYGSRCATPFSVTKYNPR